MRLFFPKKKKAASHSQGSEVDACVELFRTGINCTQAVLSTYGPRFGINREQALKLGGAFGSGMGCGETCGAVTGALMVIGLEHTSAKGGSLFSKDRTEERGQEFLERFKARNRTAICKELLGCDLGTPEGRQAAKKERHFKKRCPKYVQDAAEILEEMMKE